MSYIFFIHVLAEVHLAFFQVLAITNNVAINMVEHMSLPMCIYLTVVLLGLEVDCFLIFWVFPILIYKVAAHVCTTTSNRGAFLLSQILSSNTQGIQKQSCTTKELLEASQSQTSNSTIELQ